MSTQNTARINAALALHGLVTVGAFHPEPDDGAPDWVATLLLVGAQNGDMWEVFLASTEYVDGMPHPLDRWSRRVLEAVAAEAGGQALFPFGGPPWQPFQRWAARGEAAHPSPVGMQVSATRGLWVSYRGALGVHEFLEIAPPGEGPGDRNPCLGCPAPCLTACPVSAFAGGSYDVPRCVAHITGPSGTDCRQHGCLVRRTCPAGATALPPRAQCGFHMGAFIAARLRDAET